MKIQVIYLTREDMVDDIQHKMLELDGIWPADHPNTISYINDSLEDIEGKRVSTDTHTTCLMIQYVIIGGELFQIKLTPRPPKITLIKGN